MPNFFFKILGTIGIFSAAYPTKQRIWLEVLRKAAHKWLEENVELCHSCVWFLMDLQCISNRANRAGSVKMKRPQCNAFYYDFSGELYRVYILYTVLIGSKQKCSMTSQKGFIFFWTCPIVKLASLWADIQWLSVHVLPFCCEQFDLTYLHVHVLKNLEKKNSMAKCIFFVLCL